MTKSRKLVIFGANGLIGSAVSEYFLKKKVCMIAADISFSRLDVLKKQFDEQLILLETDATSIECVNQVFRQNPDCNKIINLCYPRNNGYGNKLEMVSSENFVDNVSQNLSCYFNVMQAASNTFAKNPGCSIINFASIYGVIPPRFDIYDQTEMTMPVEYSAIKSAIIHLSKYFAKYYLKDDIRVNCISPGGVFNSQDEIFINNYCKHTNRSGLLTANELSEACDFLLNSPNITGQNLIIDNGFSL
ncbi:SDR family oxidoreductase [Planktomarina temperata]|nr:SDR family oxidoreductase [Planktomarina temperata]